MPVRRGRPCRARPVAAALVLGLAATVAPAALAASAPPRAAAPELDLLEYLGRMQGTEGAWVGPEDIPDELAAVTAESPAAERGDRQHQAKADTRVPAPPPVEERRHVE